jgi:hypothetical protein
MLNSGIGRQMPFGALFLAVAENSQIEEKCAIEPVGRVVMVPVFIIFIMFSTSEYLPVVRSLIDC